MENKISDYSVGVFIGRLQVHELHEGHHYVIQQVVNNHKKTIIFLGVPNFIGTKKNPLDFDTRKKMVQSQYPNSVIVALPDNRDNHKWAHELDKRIREVYAHGDVLLYGSRDSFIPYYINNGGKFQTKELDQLGTFTGTDVRKMISEEVRNSVDFRSGVIYHAYNLYPRVIPTVDIAPLDELSSKILICKKYDEDLFRFIGGFVSTLDKSINDSLLRVLNKKIGNESNPTKFKFIDQIKIDDWRYKGEDDKIMTSFYQCSISGPILPNDDIMELKWIDMDEMWMKNNMIEENFILIDKLIEKFKQKNK